MSGVYHLEITESEDELKALLRTQTTASSKERIQFLYLLKSDQALTIQQAARLLGRHRVTVLNVKYIGLFRAFDTGGEISLNI